MTTAEIDIFSALANPVRRDILAALREGPSPVTQLSRHFPIGRPAVSEHLQVLRRAGLVREEPRGRERYYHLDPRPLKQVDLWLESFTAYWSDRLRALETVLEQEKQS